MHGLTYNFEINRKYNRRRDIHGRFGGQAQGGISTPVGCEYIFLFTGDSGAEFGYEDQWDDDGVFHYVGEGQVGDMEFERGNKAIRDHATIGKVLLLFLALGKGKPVQFLGTFHCGSWTRAEGPDRNGKLRSLIVFHLVPQSTPTGDGVPVSLEPMPEKYDLSQLRDIAYKAASSSPRGDSKSAKRNFYRRSSAIKKYVLARANGKCESCGLDAPFNLASGAPYLEPHHTRRVSDEGPDHPLWVAAICPNCHREIHYGLHGDAKNQELIQSLKQIEKGV